MQIAMTSAAMARHHIISLSKRSVHTHLKLDPPTLKPAYLSESINHLRTPFRSAQKMKLCSTNPHNVHGDRDICSRRGIFLFVKQTVR